MDGASGLDLFEQVRHFYPGLPVIIMSAQGTIPEAVSATQKGVFEFLTKPVDKTLLLATIRAALQQSGATQAEIFEDWREHMVTRSPIMEHILNQVRQVAGSDVSILITGATGSGKELLARAVHEADKQRQGPMVAINCGALPEQLLESELFGHVKGAFTGAISEHIGLFQAANGGTLAGQCTATGKCGAAHRGPVYHAGHSRGAGARSPDSRGPVPALPEPGPAAV